MKNFYQLMNDLLDAWIEARRMQAEATVGNRLS